MARTKKAKRAPRPAKGASAPLGKRPVTFADVARATGRPAALVRRILREDPHLVADKEVKDDVFRSARALGYDFQTLRVGKRIDQRQATFREILRKIEENPSWSRSVIVSYLANAIDMAERVQKRMFGTDA